MHRLFNFYRLALLLGFVLSLLTPVTSGSEEVSSSVGNADQKSEPKNPNKVKIKFEKHLLNPDNPLNPIYLGKTGIKRSTGDPTVSGYASEAARLGSGSHPPAISSVVLPTDKFNLINWVALVNTGAINPKPFLGAGKEDIPPLDLNILFRMRGGFVDNVVFPHDIHTYWLKCTNCHDEIFIPAAGANNVKMQEIVKGEWCGRCHGKVAFPIADCTRCHRFPPGHDIEETTVKRTKKYIR